MMLYRLAWFVWVLVLLAMALAPTHAQAPAVITLSADPPARVSQVSGSVVGTGGGNTFYYWVVARYPIGNTLPAGPARVNFAPDVLSVTNLVRVSWSAMPRATSYDVVRTTGDPNFPSGACTACLVVGGTTSTTVDDNGAALGAYTASSVQSAQANISLNNLDFAAARLLFDRPVQVTNSAGFIFPDGTAQTTATVTGTGTTEQVPFYSGANTLSPQTTGLCWDTATSRLGLGFAAGSCTPTGAMEVVGASGGQAEMYLKAYTGAGTQGAVYRGLMARGTAALPTAVQTDDRIVALVGHGFMATGFVPAFRVGVAGFAAENWTDTVNGTYLSFFTTPIGSATFVERMRISPSGLLQLGGTTSSFPAIQRSSAGLIARLADDSADTTIRVSKHTTETNCSSSASPAVCASAAAGSVVVAAAATTVVVNTTAVTANSQIFVMYDSGLGTKLSVTCNTTQPTLYGVTARTAATSFTITATAPAANPACFSYLVVN